MAEQANSAAQDAPLELVTIQSEGNSIRDSRFIGQHTDEYGNITKYFAKQGHLVILQDTKNEETGEMDNDPQVIGFNQNEFDALKKVIAIFEENSKKADEISGDDRDEVINDLEDLLEALGLPPLSESSVDKDGILRIGFGTKPDVG